MNSGAPVCRKNRLQRLCNPVDGGICDVPAKVAKAPVEGLSARLSTLRGSPSILV